MELPAPAETSPIAWSRRNRGVLLGVAIVFLVVATAAMAWWIGRPSDADPARSAKAVPLKELPARPEDIEAHGAAARSVLAPDRAREQNAAVPFSGPLSIARPFVFQGSEEDRTRALECLATAVLYEAGDDAVGEAAVAQVVLNRVRHRAFPATICGVVHQGSERSTGCQFTFTCDGSLGRQMSDAAWRRAREVAGQALAGKVDRSVGLATHYHTDWVYPYWSPELSKLARVGTHLFFGWPGSWGGPHAFGRIYRGNEGRPATMAQAASPDAAASLTGAEGGPPKILGLPQPPARLPADMGKVPLYGNRLRLVGTDGHSFGLLALSDATSTSLVNAALALCSRPGPCQVNAWSNEDDVPGEFPIPQGAKGTMVFEYLREGAAGKSSVRFDCGRFPNKDGKLCLKVSPQQLGGLTGIRFKTE